MRLRFLIVTIFISRNERVFISFAKSSTTDSRNWRVTSIPKVMIHLLWCSSDMNFYAYNGSIGICHRLFSFPKSLIVQEMGISHLLQAALDLGLQNSDQCESFDTCHFDCFNSFFCCTGRLTSGIWWSTLAANCVISVTMTRNTNIWHTSCAAVTCPWLSHFASRRRCLLSFADFTFSSQSAILGIKSSGSDSGTPGGVGGPEATRLVADYMADRNEVSLATMER